MARGCWLSRFRRSRLRWFDSLSAEGAPGFGDARNAAIGTAGWTSGSRRPAVGLAEYVPGGGGRPAPCPSDSAAHDFQFGVTTARAIRQSSAHARRRRLLRRFLARVIDWAVLCIAMGVASFGVVPLLDSDGLLLIVGVLLFLVVFVSGVLLGWRLLWSRRPPSGWLRLSVGRRILGVPPFRT